MHATTEGVGVSEEAETSLVDAPDDVLRTAAILGDREAFEVVVSRYGPQLYRYARRMLSTESDAADVIQETFVAAWRQLETFRGASSMRTWLFAICSRKIVDSRRVKRAQPIDDQLLEAIPNATETFDPFTAASNSAFLAALEDALAELPARQRATWLMREVQLMTFPEIAEVLQLSPDGARGHHHRATATLRIRLRRWQ
jgi:RNA polymerase sigma-70 factor (ECF subfamily)